MKSDDFILSVNLFHAFVLAFVNIEVKYANGLFDFSGSNDFQYNNKSKNIVYLQSSLSSGLLNRFCDNKLSIMKLIIVNASSVN